MMKKISPGNLNIENAYRRREMETLCKLPKEIMLIGRRAEK